MRGCLTGGALLVLLALLFACLCARECSPSQSRAPAGRAEPSPHAPPPPVEAPPHHAYCFEHPDIDFVTMWCHPTPNECAVYRERLARVDGPVTFCEGIDTMWCNSYPGRTMVCNRTSEQCEAIRTASIASNRRGDPRPSRCRQYVATPSSAW